MTELKRIEMDDCPPGYSIGFKIDFPDENEDDEENIAVCMPLAELDTPYTPSRIDFCSQCNCEVWRSLKAVDDFTIMCINCIQIRIKEKLGGN